MALDAVTPRVVYTGSGTTGPFAVARDGTPIYFAANSEIKVERYTIATDALTTFVEGVDYTLTGGPTAGQVTLVSALSSAYKLIIYRQTTLDQPTAFGISSSFASSTHNTIADRDRRLDQEINDKAERALKLDRTESVYGANSKRIINLADPTSNQDAVTKAYGDANYGGAAQTSAAASAAAAAASASVAQSSAASAVASATALSTNYTQPSSTILFEHVVLDSIDGSFNGVMTTFDLKIGAVAFWPAAAPQLLVLLNGVYQTPTTTYTVSGSQITFTTAPAAGDNVVMVAMKTAAGVVDIVATVFMRTLIETANTAATARTSLGVRTSALDSIAASFNGVTTTFNLTVSAAAFTPRDAYGIGCLFNGVLQEPAAAYTVSGSQITFNFTPNSGDSCTLWAISA